MPVKPSHILGMNARHRYTKMNSTASKQFGFSKLRTKELLLENGIPTAQIYHLFSSINDLENIQWDTIPTPFVIKPANGLAGKGIWIIKEKIADQQLWKNNFGEKLTEEDLSLHVSNILDGEFSVWGSTNMAIVEEMIPPHPTMAKLTFKGTPDIRVIVFNSVPIMAMARIPTLESKGKANLDQGALGLGIDLATGVTTYGIKGKSGYITHFPGSKKKINGVVIPHWNKLLETAVNAANVAGYVYMGADLFIHPEKGPMVVELNGYPGLSIQLCNRAGIKRRLERVEGLEVRDAAHGVKIAQALFAESFADDIKIKRGVKVVSPNTSITIYDDRKKAHKVKGLVNTGRFRSAISESLAKDLGLVDVDDLLWRQQEGIEGKVPVVNVYMKIVDEKVETAVVVSKRLNRTSHKIELGRKDLSGFLVGEVDG